MRVPDWTHFRSAEADPCGPCCLLERSFDLSNLPRNYIWALGYVGTWPEQPELAEVSAQVKSYSREWLVERADKLEAERKKAEQKAEKFRQLQEQRRREDQALQLKSIVSNPDAMKRQIEAGPLKMAKNLIESAGQLATGGTTDPQERLAICAECPFLGKDKRCGKCGCYTPAKARVKKSSCPIGLW